MVLRMCGKALLTMGIVLTLNEFAAADESKRLGGKDTSVKRLDLKASDADADAIEEVCRKRRLFKRRYAAETYYLPPETTYSSPPVEYSDPLPGNVPPPPMTQPEPPTLPAPATPSTYRYDGGPKPIPERPPVTQPQNNGPALGPAPSERMVATPKPATKRRYPRLWRKRNR